MENKKKETVVEFRQLPAERYCKVCGQEMWGCDTCGGKLRYGTPFICVHLKIKGHFNQGIGIEEYQHHHKECFKIPQITVIIKDSGLKNPFWHRKAEKGEIETISFPPRAKAVVSTRRHNEG